MKVLLILLIVMFYTAPALAQQEHTNHTQNINKTEQAFSCPMHPHIVSDHAIKCPICGMELQPIKQSINHSEHGGVTISSQTIQNMGVITATASLVPLGVQISGYGRITENERLTSHLSSRVEGWIESLAISSIGDVVKKDDLLFTLYSPNLIAAQEDYLSAVAIGNKVRTGATKRRLVALGMQNKAVAKLAKTRKVLTNVPFYAQNDGTVSELSVHSGSYIKAGTSILRLDDYSSVWVAVQIAEKDLPFVDTASIALVRIPHRGDSYPATVDYIYPTLDPKTRAGKIRLMLDNKNGVLKPEGYADVTFTTNSYPRLAVPDDALLPTSTGYKVIMAIGGGQFHPQPVSVGLQADGYAEITNGLNIGDKVVVSGQFLIDAESTLKNALRNIEGGGAHAGH